MLRLAFDFIITWRETRTRPNAYSTIPVFRQYYTGFLSYKVLLNHSANKQLARKAVVISSKNKFNKYTFTPQPNL